MLKKLLHSVFVATMSLLLVFGSVSKQYLHSFADHEDTTECTHHDGDGLVFSSEHHHCDFLSFTLPPFLNDIAVYIFSTAELYPPVYNAGIADVIYTEGIQAVLLRGPPTTAIL